MKSTVESLEGNKVRLSVDVDEGEFDEAVDEAFRRLAREVRIPGFRPGKAPRRVLEARLGTQVARDEALRAALPDYYEQAVLDNDVDAIAAPDIDITAGQEDGPVSFDAVVEIRPSVELEGYTDLEVTVPSPVVTDDEIDAQLDALRDRMGELEAVERPAGDGDHVRIDITGSQGGEELEGLTADDYLYEVGSEAVVPEIDQQLRGAKAGDILEFEAAHPTEGESDLHFRLLVKEVQAKVLPELDDEFAREASEFDTLDELRGDLVTRMREAKVERARHQLREGTAQAVADLVELDIPEALIEHEMQHRAQDLAMRLGSQGVSLEQFLEISGQTQEDLANQLRETAVPSVKADLALRAVAQAEGLEASDEDVQAELRRVAEQLERSVDDVRQEFERAGQLSAVRSDISKRKALDWLVERVELVDEGGEPVDRADLEAAEDETRQEGETDGGSDGEGRSGAGEATPPEGAGDPEEHQAGSADDQEEDETE